MLPPVTYEDWLALSDEERRHVHETLWDIYEGEGLVIAHQAAVRLATATAATMKVLGIATGIWHGGQHVLQITVGDEDYERCPPMLQQVFEGFRVIWMSHATRILPIEDRAQVVGEWCDELDSSGIRLHVSPTADGIEVSGMASIHGESIQFLGGHMNREYLLIRAFAKGRKSPTEYIFHLLGSDAGQCSITTMVRLRRTGRHL